MATEQPNEASIFNSARKIESSEERIAYLTEACQGDAALQERVEKLLVAYAEESQFLEQPAPEMGATIIGQAEGDLAASMEAGLAPAFGDEAAVVIGDANHSVLRSLSNSLSEVPRVSLRESSAEGEDPVARPKSPEMPDGKSDSRYQLQGEIARGGMGAIIKGRDTDLGRDLAIKVLLDSQKDKPEVVRRFVEEAQIGGQLQHPGIAPVYELGQFADKRPFFAMKLVKGETLAKLLDDREDAANERGKFIGIFEQICQTMAYAHSRGVIHRDLKPANIMVGAFGEVQVMDWGLAKVLPTGGVADEKKARQTQQGQSIIQTMRSAGSDVPGSFGSTGSETQMGSVMGTPAYMPPEQALGEIDQMNERADVFGLGAILCEILTGKPPYVGDDGTQVYRLASRGKLEDCFERLAACEADAELITLTRHCLEIEPADRPGNAGVLAESVSGYLESVETKLRETELAKADAQVRAEELKRRNKLALTAGTAIVATLVIGISVSLWQMSRATKAEALAKDEAVRATQAETLAKDEANRATAAEKRTAETLVEVAAERDAKELARKDAEDISTFLSNVMQSPDPTRDGREIKVVELLDGAAKKLETDLADQPAQRAKLQYTLGNTYHALGLYQQAIPLQEQVRDYHFDTSGPEYPNTLNAMHNLANSYHAAGRRDEALNLREEVLTLRRKVSGPEHTNTLMAMNNLAASYYDAGRGDEALKLREEVLPLYRKVSGPEHPNTLMAMNNLAISYDLTGRQDEALKMREEVLTLRRKVSGPEHPDTLSAMNNLAASYYTAGRRDEELKLREEVLPLYRKVLGPEHPDTLGAMNSLAISYHNASRKDESLKLQEELLTLFRKVSGPEHPDTLVAMHRLAVFYNNLGFDLGAGKEEESIDAWQKTLELNPRIKTNAPFYLGVLLEQAGKADEAFTAYLTAIRNGVMPGQAKEKIQGILEDPKNLESCLQAVKSNPDLKLAAFTNFASSGQAEEALSLLDEFSVTKPEETMLAMEAAALQAWFGQADEYTGFRQRTLAWAADTEDSAVAERVAKLACLMPIEDAKSQAVTLALATRGVELGKDKEEFLPWAQLSLGMAEYRNGQYEQATTTLSTAATTAPKGFRATITGTANFYRTMCLFQKDQKSEAQALFTTTEKTMKPLPANDNNPLADKAYHDHLILWLAYKEAKTLLAKSDTSEE